MNKNEGDEGLSAYIRCQIHLITHSLIVFLMEVLYPLTETELV